MADERPSFVRRIPLTPYDISGYLVPGGLLLIAIAGFEAFIRESITSGGSKIHTPVFTTIALLTQQAAPSSSWATQALVLLMAATIAYGIGHIVASISAMAIDRWYVHKAHGYPSKYLLRLTDKAPDHSQMFHRGFFFWINAYCLLRYLTLPRALPVSEIVPEPFRELLPISPIYLSWSAQIIAWMLLVMLILKPIYSAKNAQQDRTLKQLLHTDLGARLVRVFEFTIQTFAFPAKIVTRFLGNYLHTREPLDATSTEIFKWKLAKLFKLERDSVAADKILSSSSGFWYAFMHIRSTSPQLFDPIENWLRLYAFARNLAAALFLAAGYCYFWWLNQGARVELRGPEAHYTLLVLPLLFWVASFLLLLRYYYLYVGYYTKYTLRAFVYLPCDDDARPSGPVASD